MKTSRQGKIALVVSEGIVDTPYLDSVGVWTIGVGVTKAAGVIDPAAHKGKVYSVAELLSMFEKQVLPKYEAMVNRNVKVSLTQQEFDALVHFVYNVGEGNLKKSNLLKNLNAGNKQLAFEKGFHGFLKQPELRSRRDKERDIALRGSYGGVKAPLYGVNGQYKPKAKGTVDLSSQFLGTDVSAPVPTPKPIGTTSPSPTSEDKAGFLKILADLIAGIFSIFTKKPKQ